MRVVAAAIALLPVQALAAEVVWLGPPPSDVMATQVADAAGARGPALQPIDLRAAGSDWSARDADAYKALDQALDDVRMYETRFDGELLIMRGLQEPLANVTLVRDDGDRAKLFAALAYQGFAVDRFFADTLAGDERAAPYRAEINGLYVERPWMDAVALAPDRDVTPYEIAEAPQRVRFGEVKRAVMDALPAEVRFSELPPNATLTIDGDKAKPSATGAYRLLPGRHLLAVTLQDRVIARYDLRVEPAQSQQLSLPLTGEAFRTFVESAAAGDMPAVPEGLVPSIEALGGEVWLARTDDKGRVKVAMLTTSGMKAVDFRPVEPGDDTGGLSVGAGLTAGWMYSGDFYVQDPSVPRTRGTVNTGTVGLALDASYDLGLLRVVGGVDTLFTPGEDHVALYGDSSTRLRPFLFAGAGITWAQVTGGFTFPYHPTFGLRGGFPIAEGLEVLGHGFAGPGLALGRSGGTDYDAEPIYGLSVGLAYRLGL